MGREILEKSVRSQPDRVTEAIGVLRSKEDLVVGQLLVTLVVVVISPGKTLTVGEACRYLVGGRGTRYTRIKRHIPGYT